VSLAKWTLLIAWAAVVSMGLIRIASLEEEVRQAQAEIAGLRQEALAARAERDQARAEVRMLHAATMGLLNKLLLTVNEPPLATHRTLGPPLWVDPDRPRTREVQGGAPAAQ
jgi:hypothetical protein